MAVERPQFRPDIEGLRGVAILLVVLFHAGVSRLSGGFVGVDVFFVLSGFFITGLIVRELASPSGVNLPEFYARRALRLMPRCSSFSWSRSAS
jgi:peptidoglycan/LPS O-acetylase OafA/YrhL